MDILKQGALIYQRMCKHTHVFLLENGKEIRVVCKPSNFAHLAGLRKFSDVPEFWRESSANYIFKRILSDDILW